MNTNYLMKKKNFYLFYKVLLNTECCIYFQDLFFLSFCSDFNLEATVVKTDELSLKHLFTPLFSLNLKKEIPKLLIITNYRTAHQKI